VNVGGDLGATHTEQGHLRFRVWAPLARNIEVHVVSPRELFIPLKRDGHGYHDGSVEALEPGSLYMFRLDGEKECPDPTSRSQPAGVNGPSEIVDPHFPWSHDGWSGLPIEKYVIYELHVGTFTAEGTFDAIIPRVAELKEFGVTAVELMPVAQFPGDRNWGYDGVYPFAVHNSYGGPTALKRLINACHGHGLAVILDVVYNHLGPEGNYLGDFGPYFTDRYRTPWGPAINFDGPDSDEVRLFFIENALYWVTEFHIDALRIDAVHAIFDFSAYSFLMELAAAVHAQAELLNRRIYLIAESALNDTRLIRSPELGGYGLDAQWNDDFHHALRTLLTGERTGYYQDFGQFQHLAKAFEEGFVYSGEYSPYRRRRHGNSSRDIPADHFVVFSQNHDQIGNRMLGERLSTLVSFEALKLAAGAVLLSPYIPLLFMGEEYGEESPFLYFASHTDRDLITAVRDGRKQEFKDFQWQEESPDPFSMETYLRSKLQWKKRQEGQHKILLDFYRKLMQLRREIPALSNLDKDSLEVSGLEKKRVLFLCRWHDGSQVSSVMNFGETDQHVDGYRPEGTWKKIFDSAEKKWIGPGSMMPAALASGQEFQIRSFSFAVYGKEKQK